MVLMVCVWHIYILIYIYYTDNHASVLGAICIYEWLPTSVLTLISCRAQCSTLLTQSDNHASVLVAIRIYKFPPNTAAWLSDCVRSAERWALRDNHVDTLVNTLARQSRALAIAPRPLLYQIVEEVEFI